MDAANGHHTDGPPSETTAAARTTTDVPTNDDIIEEMDSAAVAAAMGFSSFGTQDRPNKKRRFNPQADAVVAVASASAAAPTSNLPHHPAQQPQQPQQPKTNADEIELDDDDDDEDDEDGGASAATAATTATTTTDREGSAPRYLDTSRPVGEVRDHLGPDPDPAATEARIQAVVAAGNAAYSMSALPPVRPPPSSAVPASPTPQMDGSALSAARRQAGWSVIDRHGFRPNLAPGPPGTGPAPGVDRSSTFSNDSGFSVHDPRQHGDFNRGFGRGQGRGRPDWYVDYYDPTSNENPWVHLEAKLGLESRGTWLSRVRESSVATNTTT